MEIIFMGVATIAAIASALAAWMSYRTSVQSLRFQKNIAKNQIHLQKLNSATTRLNSLKDILNNIFGSSDEKFISIDPLYLEIKSDLQALEKSGILKEKPSKFFSASSLCEALTLSINCHDEINHELGWIENAINELFG